MHGSLLFGFKQFVVTVHGKEAWSAILKSAGVGGWYGAVHTYSDDELTALTQATATHLGKSVAAVLEEFGTQMVPVLLGIYGSFVDPTWRTMDLLLNAEGVIHKAVRARDRTAQPPKLKPRRISDGELYIEYDSERRLCALAVGICRGVARHYKESITIDQPECMHAGAPRCRIVVRLQS